MAVIGLMEAHSNKLLVTEAARWFARLQAIDCTERERRACETWRQQSAAHEAAYQQAERTARQVTSGILSDPRLRAMAAAALNKSAETQQTTAAPWRMAACLVLSAALAVMAAAYIYRGSAAVAVAHYENNSNQPQELVLSDGTSVHLDVGGRLNARIDATSRHVELLSGRAYFEVQHDETRPFAVDAGNVRTLDLGTRFQINKDAKEVSVTLAEGSVAVSERAGEDAWKETLTPGEQLNFINETSAPRKHKVDASALTSWSHGRLVFKDTPLAEALGEVNRYATTKIRIGDNSLAAVPIGGDFIAGGDSEHVVDALAAILPLRVVHVGTHEIILFHRYESEIP